MMLQSATTQDPEEFFRSAILPVTASPAVTLIVFLLVTGVFWKIVIRPSALPSRTTVIIEPEPDDSLLRRQQEFKRYTSRHDDLNARWVPYLNDPAVFLALPGMRDLSVPEVGEFIDALAEADSTRPDALPEGRIKDSEYARAVRDAETKFAAAKKTAVHMRETQMSSEEREQLATIQKMLATAMDDAASPNERRLAYEQASRSLDRLGIALPEPMHEQLETAVRGLIEPSASGATPADAHPESQTRP